MTAINWVFLCSVWFPSLLEFLFFVQFPIHQILAVFVIFFCRWRGNLVVLGVVGENRARLEERIYFNVYSLSNASFAKDLFHHVDRWFNLLQKLLRKFDGGWGSPNFYKKNFFFARKIKFLSWKRLLESYHNNIIQ